MPKQIAVLSPKLGAAKMVPAVAPVIIKDSGFWRPKLKIVTFNCDQGNFHTWIATFNSSVGDFNTLCNTDKLIYLWSFLSGKSLNLIKHMEVNAENA